MGSVLFTGVSLTAALLSSIELDKFGIVDPSRIRYPLSV
jgi:hypothetical protein